MIRHTPLLMPLLPLRRDTIYAAAAALCLLTLLPPLSFAPPCRAMPILFRRFTITLIRHHAFCHIY